MSKQILHLTVIIVLFVCISNAFGEKVCPLCKLHFTDDVIFCPDCGVELVKTERETDVIEGRLDEPIGIFVNRQYLDFDSLDSYIYDCYLDGKISKADFQNFSKISTSIKPYYDSLSNEGKETLTLDQVKTLVEMSEKAVTDAKTGKAEPLALLLLGEIECIRAELDQLNSEMEYIEASGQYSKKVQAEYEAFLKNLGVTADQYYQMKPQPPFSPTATFDAEEPRPSFEKAIIAYQKIVLLYKDFEYVDAAYYGLGICLESMNERKAAADTFNALVTNIPNSKFCAECYLRIGNYYFDVYDFETAIKYYDKVENKPENWNLYRFALYKIGWSYFCLAGGISDQNYINAFDALLELVDMYSSIPNSALNPDDYELIDDAKRFSVISICEYSGKPDPYILINLLEERHLEYLIPEELHLLGDLYLYKKDMSGIAASCYKIILDSYPEYNKITEVQKSFNTAKVRIQNRDINSSE